MGAVIEIRDARSGRTVYVTTRSGHSTGAGWTSSYSSAARFNEREVEDEMQFWRELMDDPEVEVAAVQG